MATRAGEMVTTPQRRSAGHGFLPYLLSLPALLVCIGAVEFQFVAQFPQAALCDEAPPNVGHAKRTVTR